MKSALKLLDLRRLGFVAIFLLLLTLLQLTDPDYFWHLKTGQYLLDHGALPGGDIFSYTNPGRPWMLHEWLFEAVLAGTYALLGEFGVRLITVSLGTAATIIVFAMANRFLGKPYAAFFLALILLVLMAPSLSPRPQLVTFLLFALYLRVLTDFKYAGKTRCLLALPPLMAVWVNFHGGYIGGLALLALFVACEWLTFLAKDHRDTAQWRRLKWLSLAAIATLLSSLVNPYFVGHWLYPFQVMGMEASRTYISEWHSPNFHRLQGQVYLVLVFAYFIVTIYRRRKADITELAIPLFFAAMGFVAARHIPLAAIALIPFTAVALAQQPLTQLMPARALQACSAWYNRHVRHGSDLGDKEYLLNWVLLGLILAGFLLYYAVNHASIAETAKRQMPVEATEFIIKTGIHGRMFNTYQYGGYLIYRLYPDQQVFIDGRADMYGDAFMREYGEIINGGKNWERLFDKYRIDYVLVQHDDPLRQLLLERGDFKLVHEDKTNSVLLKNCEKYAAIMTCPP
jgi:hypothetical protein